MLQAQADYGAVDGGDVGGAKGLSLAGKANYSGQCYQKAFDSVVLDRTTEREVYHCFAEEAFRLGAEHSDFPR